MKLTELLPLKTYPFALNILFCLVSTSTSSNISYLPSVATAGGVPWNYL